MKTIFVTATLVLVPTVIHAQANSYGLKLPPGFVISEYADSSLANDIYTMTIDPKSRIVVAGRGYIRILVDEDKDGKADKALPFADTPKDGAMGLHWEDDTLYVTGDGGLRMFHDKNHDDRADGPSKLIRKMRTGGEHHAHAIRRGPDGWLYVLCGNHTGIDRSYAQLPTSPIKNVIGGCVLRFTPDLKYSEIVAHGFRNAYGMDFNSDGELFTYDSDNERCVTLPWYEYTRFYHVIPGGFYGWMSPQRAQWWRCPPYFLDVVAPVTTLDRGSPTGVACYRHVQFPPKYQGGMFALDWTFGKVYFLQMEHEGATYRCKKEIFIEAMGDSGFAPTGIVVHPQTGDLFISIGGRGTRGGVYRVRYEGKVKSNKTPADLQPEARSLQWHPASSAGLLKKAKSSSNLKRLQALQLIWRHAEHLKSNDLIDAVSANWNDEDRYLRQACAKLIRKLPKEKQVRLARKAIRPNEQTTYYLATYDSQPNNALRAVQTLINSNTSTQIRLESLRLAELTLGGLVDPKTEGTIWEGYSLRETHAGIEKKFEKADIPNLLRTLRNNYTGKPSDQDIETARLLACLRDSNASTHAKILKSLQTEKHPVLQIHLLTVLAKLKAPVTQKQSALIANTLVQLNREIETRHLNIDRHWPLRIKELYAGLAGRYPKLHEAVLHQEDFGRPEHALFALAAGFPIKKAASVFLKKANADPDFQWNASVVKVIEKRPPEQSLPTLRKLWGSTGLDSVLLPILAKNPTIEDRHKFVEGLKSPQLSIVQTSIRALKKLRSKVDGREILALLSTLNRLPKEQGKQAAKEIQDYLQLVTGQKFGNNRKAWNDWFASRYPDLSAQLLNVDNIDLKKWQNRISTLDFSKGDRASGMKIFRKANCLNCHSGGQALGPDLRGVGKRFSQNDLLWSVLQPSREIPERYQTTLIETQSGKIYQGLIIYQAVDGAIMQVDAATTVRIPGDQIATQVRMTNSMMPAGLLDNLTDREIVDLFAYLKSL